MCVCVCVCVTSSCWSSVIYIYIFLFLISDHHISWYMLNRRVSVIGQLRSLKLQKKVMMLDSSEAGIRGKFRFIIMAVAGFTQTH